MASSTTPNHHNSHARNHPLPQSKFPGKVILVSNDYIDSLVSEIFDQEKLLGFDAEWEPFVAPGQITFPSVIQISSLNLCVIWLMDRFPKGYAPATLIKYCSGGKNLPVLIGFATANDGAKLAQVGIDLHACDIQELKFKKMGSLAHWSWLLLGLHTSKSAQLTHWNDRNLTSSQIEYAATDAWVTLLLAIYSERYDEVMQRAKELIPLPPPKMIKTPRTLPSLTLEKRHEINFMHTNAILKNLTEETYSSSWLAFLQGLVIEHQDDLESIAALFIEFAQSFPDRTPIYAKLASIFPTIGLVSSSHAFNPKGIVDFQAALVTMLEKSLYRVLFDRRANRKQCTGMIQLMSHLFNLQFYSGTAFMDTIREIAIDCAIQKAHIRDSIELLCTALMISGRHIKDRKTVTSGHLSIESIVSFMNDTIQKIDEKTEDKRLPHDVDIRKMLSDTIHFVSEEDSKDQSSVSLATLRDLQAQSGSFTSSSKPSNSSNNGNLSNGYQSSKFPKIDFRYPPPIDFLFEWHKQATTISSMKFVQSYSQVPTAYYDDISKFKVISYSKQQSSAKNGSQSKSNTPSPSTPSSSSKVSSSTPSSSPDPPKICLHCQKCGKKYVNPSALNRHMVQKHSADRTKLSTPKSTLGQLLAPTNSM